MDDMERAVRFAREQQFLRNILDQRYSECDTEGHKRPEGNLCNYCYRRISYDAPRTDAELRSRKDLPLLQRPMDAPVMMRRRREEISSQQSMDYFKGLLKLKEDPVVSSELEKMFEE